MQTRKLPEDQKSSKIWSTVDCKWWLTFQEFAAFRAWDCLDPEYEGINLLQNIGNWLPVHTA